MNLFFTDSKDIQPKSLIVRGQEADHITKVLRHSIGDTVFVTDGRGNCYKCQINDLKKSTVFLDINDTKKEPVKKPQVTLCLGVIKKRDRLEFAVEKAVELGVSKFILFKGEHSQKGNVREDRLESTAIAAMKQSLRFYLPEIIIEESLEDAVSTHSGDCKIIVADETIDDSNQEFNESQEYFLIVGPEGGFSNSERDFLKTIKADYYSLGEKRLRAETAAIVMVDRFANQK
ncbi:RsmE family RNA methyltransferase [Rhodohalobacter sp. 614A]|uniref:RsmE family RNA methyltransferase n=1 Tax=Rhodohalobacter sp. 614A TaxID=2908649 RepID=UPI001F24FFD2|nr:RsmE family RNA methyltransferase [Rhodohalobacter sp. 614A]